MNFPAKILIFEKSDRNDHYSADATSRAIPTAENRSQAAGLRDESLLIGSNQVNLYNKRNT